MTTVRILLCLTLAAAVALPATARRVIDILEADLPHNAIPLEWVEATVNKSIITSGEVDELLLAYLEERDVRDLDDFSYQEHRNAVVQEAINDLLLVEEARRLDLRVRKDVLDAHVDAELRKQRRRYANPDDFERELRLVGSSLAAWRVEVRDKIEQELLLEMLFKTIAVSRHATVSDAEVEQFLAERPEAREEFERVLLRRITLRLPQDPSEEDVARRMEEIRVIAARLHAGESFTDLALELSEDAESREQGGNIGWVVPGQWPEVEAAFTREPGDLLGPIQDEQGMHIVQVLRTMSVRDALQHRKRQYVLRSYLADLREAAQIDVKLKPYALYRADRQRFQGAIGAP